MSLQPVSTGHAQTYTYSFPLRFTVNLDSQNRFHFTVLKWSGPPGLVALSIDFPVAIHPTGPVWSNPTPNPAIQQLSVKQLGHSDRRQYCRHQSATSLHWEYKSSASQLQLPGLYQFEFRFRP